MDNCSTDDEANDVEEDDDDGNDDDEKEDKALPLKEDSTGLIPEKGKLCIWTLWEETLPLGKDLRL